MSFLSSEDQRLLLRRLFAGRECYDTGPNGERIPWAEDRLDAYALAQLRKGSTVQSVADIANSAVQIALENDRRLDVLDAGGNDSSAADFESRVKTVIQELVRE